MVFIKEITEKIRLYMQFDFEETEFTDLFFYKSLQLTILLALIGTIANIVTLLPSFVILTTGLLFFSLLLLFIYTKRFHNFFISKILYLVTIVGFLNVLFFINGGIYGPNLTMFMVAFTLFVFFTNRNFQKVVIALFSINIFVLIYLQFKFPALIHGYLDSKQQFVDHLFVIFVPLLAEIPLIIFIQHYFVKSKKRMEESERLKSSFLANMSHEIRTPMNAILGFSEMLRDHDLEKKEKNQYLDVIRDNGRILLQIITNIVQLSKIDAELVQLRETNIHLKEFMFKVLDSFHSELNNRKELKINIEVPKDDQELVLISDELVLFQILSNLLANAIKYTSYGLIQMGFFITEERDNLILFVSDTGIGIKESAKDFIFDRFRQADEDYTRDYSGSGLGLTICKELTSLLDGEIWVESKEKVGSTFYISFPLKFASTNQIKLTRYQLN